MPSPLTLPSPSLSHAVLSWELMQAGLTMRALAVGPAEEHYVSFTYAEPPEWQNSMLSGTREAVMSVTSICKGASCGKSQGLMLSH